MEIVRMTFGSHVYGTDTPQSDRDEKGVFQDCLDNIVLGKKFSENTTIENVLEPLEKMYNEYGHRATLAMQNKGVDWKAISHAYRCMYQLRELKTSGEITFPLKESVYLLDIKLGRIDYSIVQDELHELMVEVIDMESNLPDKPDYEFWEKKILYYYLNK